jgi:hypothetical protein
VARPDAYPYADIAGGGERYRLAGETINEARLYDFYQRQADYYMGQPASGVPDILPAYPGFDGGLHGHWGKHNQNNHDDGRWNAIDHGSLLTQVFAASSDVRVLKWMSVMLCGPSKVSVCFDPMNLSYRAAWEGGFVRFEPFRWGTSRNTHPDGETWYVDAENRGARGSEQRYLGGYRHGKRVIFHYRVGETEILDMPSLTEGGNFLRTLNFAKGGACRLRAGVGGTVRITKPVGFEV